MVERVSDNHPDYLELHDRYTRQRHGMLLRDDLAWEEYWRWDTDDIVVALYYDQEHVAQGYVVYLLEEDVFKIKELIYLSQEARHGLWNYVGAHFSMIEKVKGYNYTNEPMAFLLEDSEIYESIRPYFMARIVDFERFILDYPFAMRPSGASCTFSSKTPWPSGTGATSPSPGTTRATPSASGTAPRASTLRSPSARCARCSWATGGPRTCAASKKSPPATRPSACSKGSSR